MSISDKDCAFMIRVGSSRTDGRQPSRSLTEIEQVCHWMTIFIVFRFKQIKIRVLTVFQETSQSPPDLQHPAEPIEVAFPCPYFSLVVDTAELLKRRLTKKRKAHPLYTRFVSLSDSLKGRP